MNCKNNKCVNKCVSMCKCVRIHYICVLCVEVWTFVLVVVDVTAASSCRSIDGSIGGSIGGFVVVDVGRWGERGAAGSDWFIWGVLVGFCLGRVGFSVF